MDYSRRYYPHAQTTRPINPWAIRLPLLVVTGLILMFFILIATLAGYQFMYQDKVYPGVSTVYGLDLTGLTRDEVQSALQERFTYAQDATFVFHYTDPVTLQTTTWEYTASDLGVELDMDATLDAVFNAGRDDGTASNLWNQWKIWRNGYPVSPKIVYNQSRAEELLQQLATDSINQPVLDATLTIRNSRAYATPSQVGYAVNVPATLEVLRQRILDLSLRSEINLVVRRQDPTLWSADEAAVLVNQALDVRGVTFFVPTEQGENSGPWTATPESIENMLRIERVEDEDGTAHYEVKLLDDQTRQFLEQIAPDLRRQATNARFIFNDTVGDIELLAPSQPGREVDVDATLATFKQTVFSTTDRTVPISFIEVPARVNETMTAREMGIQELVISATTYFLGSSEGRKTNVQVAADRFNGVVIPPHSLFSFNEWLGDVSLDTGFEEALIIYGNQTITGVGGGVCQVSTTAFQAAFYGGFPIVQRIPHGYRVGYYETGEGPGMDATVYSPIVDFLFENDTDYYLLIETETDIRNNTVTFRYYSTDTGRSVVKEGPYIRNVQPAPPPIYMETPGVSGTIQVDYAVSGAEVYVYRTILDANGNTLVDREEFYSNYVPWAAKYQVPVGDSRAN